MRKLVPILAATAVLAAALLVASPWASGSSRAPAAAPKVFAYSHYVVGPVSFTPTLTTVASMPLPRGKYLVDAKLVVEVDSGPADISCELSGAADDIAKAEQLRSDADGIETRVSVCAPVSAPCAAQESPSVVYAVCDWISPVSPAVE